MTANVGTVDRIVRIAAGAALIGVALGLFGPAYRRRGAGSASFPS